MQEFLNKAQIEIGDDQYTSLTDLDNSLLSLYDRCFEEYNSKQVVRPNSGVTLNVINFYGKRYSQIESIDMFKFTAYLRNPSTELIAEDPFPWSADRKTNNVFSDYVIFLLNCFMLSLPYSYEDEDKNKPIARHTRLQMFLNAFIEEMWLKEHITSLKFNDTAHFTLYRGGRNGGESVVTNAPDFRLINNSINVMIEAKMFLNSFKANYLINSKNCNCHGADYVIGYLILADYYKVAARLDSWQDHWCLWKKDSGNWYTKMRLQNDLKLGKIDEQILNSLIPKLQEISDKGCLPTIQLDEKFNLKVKA